MVRRMMTDTATLVRVPLTRTAYKNSPDFDNAVDVHTGLCSVQPFSGIEDEIDRDTRVSQWRLITDDPGFYSATAQDYIEIGGVLHKIDGRPFLWTLRGQHHIEMTVRLVEG